MKCELEGLVLGGCGALVLVEVDLDAACDTSVISHVQVGFSSQLTPVQPSGSRTATPTVKSSGPSPSFATCSVSGISLSGATVAGAASNSTWAKTVAGANAPIEPQTRAAVSKRRLRW